MSESLEEISRRFWSKVDIKSKDECWTWLGGKQSSGYGTISLGGRQSILAHQVALWLDSGTIVPKGMDTLHSCDNRLCCNPAHLSIGTRKDNMVDCSRRGRVGGQHIDAATAAKIYSYRSGDLTQKEVANLFGVKLGTVSDIHNGYRFAWLTGQKQSGYRRGEANRKSFLTREAVLIIYNLRGIFTGRAIAELFEIKPTLVSDIHRGKTWAWLTGARR